MLSPASTGTVRAELPRAAPHRWHEDPGGRKPTAHLRRGLVDRDGVALPAGAEAHVCGPPPVAARVHRRLLDRGWTADHVEVSGPDRELGVA